MGDGYFFFLSGNQARYAEPAAALWMINDPEVLPDEGRNDPASCGRTPADSYLKYR